MLSAAVTHFLALRCPRAQLSPSHVKYTFQDMAGSTSHSNNLKERLRVPVEELRSPAHLTFSSPTRSGEFSPAFLPFSSTPF